MSHGWRILFHPMASSVPSIRKAGFLGFLFLAVNAVIPAGLLQLIQGWNAWEPLTLQGLEFFTPPCSHREGQAASAADVPVEANAAQQTRGLSQARSHSECPGPAEILPSRTQALCSWALDYKGQNSLSPLR